MLSDILMGLKDVFWSQLIVGTYHFITDRAWGTVQGFFGGVLKWAMMGALGGLAYGVSQYGFTSSALPDLAMSMLHGLGIGGAVGGGLGAVTGFFTGPSSTPEPGSMTADAKQVVDKEISKQVSQYLSSFTPSQSPNVADKGPGVGR